VFHGAKADRIAIFKRDPPIANGYIGRIVSGQDLKLQPI
jgi:hypothetical protein